MGWIADVKPGATLKLGKAANNNYHDWQLLAMVAPERRIPMSGGTFDLNGDAVNRVPVISGVGTLTVTTGPLVHITVLSIR